MRTVRCYDYFVLLGDTETCIYDLDGRSVGTFPRAEGAYEAYTTQNDKYVVLFNYDEESFILDIEWDNDEEEYTVRTYAVHLEKDVHHLSVKGVPPMRLSWTTYSERKKLEQMREEFARRAALSEIPAEQQ